MWEVREAREVEEEGGGELEVEERRERREGSRGAPSRAGHAVPAGRLLQPPPRGASTRRHATQCGGSSPLRTRRRFEERRQPARRLQPPPRAVRPKDKNKKCPPCSAQLKAGLPGVSRPRPCGGSSPLRTRCRFGDARRPARRLQPPPRAVRPDADHKENAHRAAPSSKRGCRGLPPARHSTGFMPGGPPGDQNQIYKI